MGGVEVVCPGFGSPGRGVFVALEVVSVEPALEELLEKLLEGSAGVLWPKKRLLPLAWWGLVLVGSGGWLWLAVGAALQSLFRCVSALHC